MKTFLALLFSSYWLLLAQAKGLHDCDHVCPDVSQPVCGSNGETYKSKCLLKLQKCISGGKLHVAYDGPCRVRPSCKQERERILSRVERGGLLILGMLIPDCDEDGSYSAVQCHVSSKTCWCADKFGNEIDGTKVRFKKPDCRGRSPRSYSHKSNNERYARILKGCSKENRVSFNKKVVASFKKEMARYSKKKGKSDATEIVQWKMRELDKDKSGNLQHKELKSLIKKLKKAYSPRKCGKTLFYYCDKDHNDVISRREWLGCLGVQGPSNKPSARPDVARCLKEHLKASELQARDPNPNRFIPTCDTDGTYTLVQCQKLSRYCWCVNPITGKNIPRTSVRNARPDCSKHVRPTGEPHKAKKRPTTKSRTIRKPPMPAKTEKPSLKLDRGKKHKECDDANWARFTREFFQHFRNELESMTKIRLRGKQNVTDSRPPNLLDALSMRLPDTMILAWAFSQLDTDRDRLVSIDELFVSHMKKVYGRIRRGRKCSKKLAITCDYDHNRRLSLGEWRKCLRRRSSKGKSNPFSRPGFIGRYGR